MFGITIRESQKRRVTEIKANEVNLPTLTTISYPWYEKSLPYSSEDYANLV